MKLLSLLLVLFAASHALALEPTQRREVDDALIYRSAVGRADDIKILLERGANPDTRNDENIPVIAIAAERWDNEAAGIVIALVEKGAEFAYADEPKFNPLIIATRLGNTDIVKYLLGKGANYYVRDERGRPLVDIATQAKREEARALIQAAINADLERKRAERSLDNLNKFVKQFSYDNCAVQYLRYYLSSEQESIADPATYNARIQTLMNDIAQTNGKLREIFNIRVEDSKKVSTRSIDYIFKELEDMVSNRNRRAQGFGKEEDLAKRCNKIANRWEVVVLDQNRKKVTNLSDVKGPVKVEINIH
ncbi:MAG: ankyrin repeat domain-containing protein [Alphaproteobacteria bacterium]|nr:ankyrin repeat domain-containing protein [Alphaproteobacteria bacterium]